MSYLLSPTLLLLLLLSSALAGAAGPGDDGPRVPILVYHRFGPVVADSMTVTTAVFAAQLDYLREHGYVVIPLRRLIAYRRGEAPPPPPRGVVITADDGHRSVYTDMFPLVQRYRIPVTLFIYPSAISNASYALTWEQLQEMQATGLFDIQSHTFWHPNFKQERKRRAPADYAAFVDLQMSKAKQTLERRVGGRIDLLAWPFGIYDEDLIRHARQAGYVAAFTLERRHAGAADELMAMPRYLMSDRDRGQVFARLLAGAAAARVIR